MPLCTASHASKRDCNVSVALSPMETLQYSIRMLLSCKSPQESYRVVKTFQGLWVCWEIVLRGLWKKPMFCTAQSKQNNHKNGQWTHESWMRPNNKIEDKTARKLWSQEAEFLALMLCKRNIFRYLLCPWNKLEMQFPFKQDRVSLAGWTVGNSATGFWMIQSCCGISTQPSCHDTPATLLDSNQQLVKNASIYINVQRQSSHCNWHHFLACRFNSRGWWLPWKPDLWALWFMIKLSLTIRFYIPVRNGRQSVLFIEICHTTVGTNRRAVQNIPVTKNKDSRWCFQSFFANLVGVSMTQFDLNPRQVHGCVPHEVALRSFNQIWHHFWSLLWPNLGQFSEDTIAITPWTRWDRDGWWYTSISILIMLSLYISCCNWPQKCT